MPFSPAVVLGVGPGLGSSVALRFAREGYPVALLSRTKENRDPIQQSIEEQGGKALSVPCDSTDLESVKTAFSMIRDTWGDPEVLVYNAAAFDPGGILEIEPDAFVHCWKTNCLGAYYAFREVLPSMVDREEGTIIVTGATASLRGSANYATMAVGKNGLRALAQSTAREFGPKGVHVSHVVVDGVIDLPWTRDMMPEAEDEEFLDPDEIAETYWTLHTQNRSAWTLELDLRPHVEDF